MPLFFSTFLMIFVEPPTTAVPEKVEMLTIKECIEAVKGLNEYTVRQLIARKEIPSIRTGQSKRGKILVPKAALLRYFICSNLKPYAKSPR
ncbi:MAG: hypothetical protein ACI4JS_10255 [Oscillospiraceae bacterium]